MDWMDLLQILGVSSILSTLIPYLVTRHFNKKDEKKDELDAIKDRLAECDEERESLKNDINELREKHQSDFEGIENNLVRINKTLSILTMSEQAILRDRIIQMYNTYYIDKKYMPIYARESLDHMYKEYKALGGNGVIDGLVQKLYSLPTELVDDK